MDDLQVQQPITSAASPSSASAQDAKPPSEERIAPEPITAKPWDKRIRESSKAYAAFCVYRDAGPQRSLRAVAEKLIKSETIIARWSGKFDWVERSAAYDGYMDSIRVAERVKEVRDAAETRRKAYRALMAKGLVRLQSLKPDDISARDTTQMVDVGAKGERLEMGEPTEINKATGEQTHKLKFDLSAIPADLLKLIADGGDDEGTETPSKD